MLRQIFAVLAYLGTLGIVTYAAVWVNNLGEISPTLAPAFPLGIDGASLVDLKLGDGAAAFFNIALLCLFALQHNVMSRLGIKAKMRKSAIPFSWERSVFIATAGFAFGTALLLWQPIPWRVWQVSAPYDKVLVAISILGFLLHFASTWAIDHFDLFGLKQAFMGLNERDYPKPKFVNNVFYKFVRHPLYLGYLVFLFSTPVMSAGRLLFASFMLLFVLWSIPMEEADLETLMGESYAHYRKSVPALIPSMLPYKPVQAAPTAKRTRAE